MAGPPCGVIPINPYDVMCPVEACEARAELVCPVPTFGADAPTAGVLLCPHHYDVIRRVISTKRGRVTISRSGPVTTVRLVPPPPITRREWNRVRTDLVAILHDLHPTTKGH